MQAEGVLHSAGEVLRSAEGELHSAKGGTAPNCVPQAVQKIALSSSCAWQLGHVFIFFSPS